MGKYMRKCRGMGEVAVMEVGPPLTRARTLALAAAAAAAGGKRKRVGTGGELQLRSRRAGGQPDKQLPCRKSVRTATDLIRNGAVEAPSRCSSNGSCELDSMRSAAEVEERIETATGFDSTRSSRGSKPSSGAQVEPEELDSATMTTPPPSAVETGLRRRTEAAMVPSAAEIDEFFAAAEMRERKRFADKYNYDVEKDVPLEGGRYEWVRLIPQQQAI